MTRDHIVTLLAAVERRLASEVRVRRVIVRADGSLTGRVYDRGAFVAPASYVPPTFDALMTLAKKGRPRD